MVSSRFFPFVSALLIAFTAALANAAPSPAPDAKRRFDVPAGDATQTLARFAEQADREIVFSPATVRGVQTNAVRGDLSPREALDLLVARTPLIVSHDATTGALAVKKATADPNAPRAAAAVTRDRPAPTTPNESETVQLSPFEVTTGKDVGYAAQETLSGTRLLTSLRDVGASLAVLSPEFLEDLGVNSFDLALLFTPSVDTYQGDTESNLQGANMRFGNGQQVSLRGFTTGPSSSHDFFPALERNDTYNVEQVTLSRGPNSMLFGLGGSAGTAVSATKRAYFSKRRPTLSLQTDRWGSQRVSLDVNQPLVAHKLAFRLNVLHSEKREFRKYEGLQQDRVTVGVRYQPFKNTEIIVNHEEYRTGFNQAPLLPPFDLGALRWAASGRPTVEFVSGGTAWATAGRSFLDANGRPVTQPSGNGLITSRADFDPTQSINQITAPTLRYVVGLNLTNPVVNYRWGTSLVNSLLAGASASNTSNLKQADPWNLFGLSRDANLWPGTWDEPARRNQGRWTSVFIQQEIARGLHLELAGNFARDRIHLMTDSLHIISIDVDRYLPNGQLNPGYLIPYSEAAGGGQDRDGFNTSNSVRGTLSYEHDFSKLHRWLGNQSFSSLFQSESSDSELTNYRVQNLATAGLPGFSADITGNNHQLWPRVYYVNGRVPDPLPGMFKMVEKIPEANSFRTALGATVIDSVPSNYARRVFLQPVKSRNQTDSLSLAWIGRFFRDRLVTTAGYRRDAWKLYGIPASRSTIDPQVANSAVDPLRQYFNPASQINFNPTPTAVTTVTNNTLGGVLHTISWLDLTVSRSSNFTPNSNTTNTNYLNERLPNRRAVTTDYGVRFYALNNRLAVSINKFDNVAENESRNSAAFTNGVRSILTRLRDNYKDLGDSHFANLAPQGDYRVDNNQGLLSTWNYVAKGYELSATFNPSPSWRFYVSGSSNSNVLGAHVPDLALYLNTPTEFQGLATYARMVTELRKVAAGQPSSAFDLNPNSAADRSKAATDATFIETQSAAVKQAYDDDQALTGRTSNRNGKYAANGLATHTFRQEGWMKGLSLGGNFRWRSASIIGYERKLNAAGRPFGVINVAKPIEGDDYWDFGLMLSQRFRLANGRSVKLQLNVENPFNWTKSRLVAADYDSQGYYGTVDAIVPIRYELRRPRNFLLSATYTF